MLGKINGLLPLELREGKFFVVAGGPYLSRPENTFGVKLAKELRVPADHALNIEDFGVPSVEEMQLAVEVAVEAMVKGHTVYAGCKGGIGRTGLFLSCLSKAFGHEPPVKYVRAQYLPHAVETQAQMRLVGDFRPSKRTLSLIRWAKLKSFVGLQRGLNKNLDHLL